MTNHISCNRRKRERVFVDPDSFKRSISLTVEVTPGIDKERGFDDEWATFDWSLSLLLLSSVDKR